MNFIRRLVLVMWITFIRVWRNLMNKCKDVLIGPELKRATGVHVGAWLKEHPDLDPEDAAEFESRAYWTTWRAYNNPTTSLREAWSSPKRKATYLKTTIRNLGKKFLAEMHRVRDRMEFREDLDDAPAAGLESAIEESVAFTDQLRAAVQGDTKAEAVLSCFTSDDQHALDIPPAEFQEGMWRVGKAAIQILEKEYGLSASKAYRLKLRKATATLGTAVEDRRPDAELVLSTGQTRTPSADRPLGLE